MENWAGRVALVTGASAGIGAAISSALVKHGLKVVGCARNLTRLQEFSDKLNGSSSTGTFYPVQCDVGNAEDIMKMFKTIEHDQGGVDICINNAALVHNAPLLTGTNEDWAQMLNVNVLGLSICTRETIKSMRDRKVDDGYIINMCSMSGHRVKSLKNTHFYAGTKHAVKALGEGLRWELREIKSNIRITEFSPAVVETEGHSTYLGKEVAKQMLSSAKYLEPKDIADLVVYVLSAPSYVQVQDIILRSVYQES